ncbi:histidine kinase/DNA gyrase B/HSP90-like ATPase [Herbinix hemicellulosilytica]|uniref:HAMP domain-containing protein n=1 Tax=Herbinix hemicellulosilytica TaxID=1564487 RepID=A0A0H5SFI6_HERHM|nr:histidine kinase [Herbinix hemicellulosilytica]RBP60277.1 histidine kinase/DNA gyrase B/HSP90-like ATPase [Herbinix hemicellulosilytica]CRZ33581.1 hypothetical protein HHT355_0373 [Herbinix hemicellulosilytica]
MKKKSFINDIFRLLIILTVLLFTILGIFLFSSYKILENEIKDSSESFLAIYSNEAYNSINEMDGLLKNITSRNVDLAKIKSSNSNERILASISLYNYMQELLQGKENVDLLVIYDANYDICLDAIKSGFNFNKKNSLRKFTGDVVKTKEINSFEWNFLEKDNETYLYKMLLSDSRAIAIYVSINNFLADHAAEGNGNHSIVLVNKDGIIGRVWGSVTGEISPGQNINGISSDNYYQAKKEIVPGQLYIYSIAKKSSILKQTNIGMIIVAAAVCLTMLFMVYVLKFTKKEIALPMQHIVNDIERIKNGEYETRISGNFRRREFQMLQEVTNQMVDEIVNLKIQSYEKKIELQDMELKSIKLQIRPHFFLNALTTISSLSSQGKFEDINTYINSLSKNIRYMFRAGLRTVTVKEEINHVKNYFEMQELKYPGSVFYLIDLPKELEEWKIPQMIIHTFIENEFKHAVSLDNTLTILIKVSKQTYQNEDMLLIEIEDDGKGYPKEVIDYMNNNKKPDDTGNRVGLWSMKRMMEIMYEKEGLIKIENLNPFGCLNKIYVPRKTKNKFIE